MAKTRLPLSFLCILFLFSACAKKAPQQPPPPPVPSVEVVTLQPQDISLEPEYPARTQGSDEVDVRARIRGIILKNLYTEGVQVEEGDPLFQIDPELYQAEVNRTAAQLEQANARLRFAEINWNRVSQLFKERAVSEQVKDQAFHELESAKADVSMARAQLETAQINLNYTLITAPIPGITGLQNYDEGNLIQVDSLLTRIVQLDPLYVMFSYPDREFFRLRKILEAQGNHQKLAAELVLEDGTRYPSQGGINFTDTTINRETGTIQVRAVFPNPDHEILSGEFVRIILKDVLLKDVLLVPQEAVMQGPQGTFVYCVDKGNVAKIVPIELGPAKNGHWIVDKGLNPGDTVIKIGMIKVRPGSPVKILSPTNNKKIS